MDVENIDESFVSNLNSNSDYTVRNLWIIANSILFLYVVFLLIYNKCSKDREKFRLYEYEKKFTSHNTKSNTVSNTMIKENASIQENL